MSDYATKNIRNVCLIAHGNAGKTSLCEAMLYNAKSIDRLGKTLDGNTVSDFDPEEIKRNWAASIPPLLPSTFHGLSSFYLIL